MSIRKEDLPKVTKLVNKDQITEDTRLYFEIGHKLDMSKGSSPENWKRTERYLEIRDPLYLRDHDKNMSDTWYLEHHNFLFTNEH
jgi:hypothetical protein